MANTTKNEALHFAANHERTAHQIRQHMLYKLVPGSDAYKRNEEEAVDHETRAKDWREYAAKQ